MVLEETTWVYEHIYCLNSALEMNKKEKKNIYLLAFNLSNDDIIS